MFRPKTIGFGIHVDGRDAGISFSTIADAEGGAIRLCAEGYKAIEIFDRVSGRVIERVAPNPTNACAL